VLRPGPPGELRNLPVCPPTSRRPRPRYVRLPQAAWRAVAGTGPPTEPFGLRYQPSPVDGPTAHATLGLALRIGEAKMAVGASAADVTATVLRVAAVYGFPRCHVDVTYTSLTVSFERGDASPLTMMRIVQVRGLDYNRLYGVTDLARAIGAERLDTEEAHRRLDALVSAPDPYRRRIHALGLAGVAGAVGFQLGGGWLVALVAALTTAAVELIMRALDRRGLPMFFQRAAGAAVATGVAVLLVAGDVDVRSSLVVAAGIVALLAGLSLVGAADDAISGFPRHRRREGLRGPDADDRARRRHRRRACPGPAGTAAADGR
jgi:uncharacterized membrane protein YjjP (DUF1212 family)